ncbi:restriction endonuclease subunit S [Morganella morganii]|uniref:restriction endonuclease subunit S n=1 Tax=Morganella morganii TaxID=582 RepID=UPI0021CF4E63|nr:restriction endonuclease subunit S [Morganella morganii]MCU6274047.1 restriction endonuclease subunit S [Morganella morganii]
MSFDNLPFGWKLVTLEDAMDAIIDYRGKTPKKTESGIPLITAKIVKGGYVLEPFEFIAKDNYDSWMVRGRPQVGDVVLTTEAPLGETAQLTSSNVALAQRIVTLRGKKGLLDNDFLLCVLQSDFVQHQLESRASGSTVKGIKQSELRKISLPIPPLHQQKKISQVLKSLSNKLVCNTQTNQTLEQMAQAIFKSWFVDFDPVKAKMNGEQPEGMDSATASLFPDKLVKINMGEIPEGWQLIPVGKLLLKTIGGDWGKEEPDVKHTEKVRIVRGTDIPKLHGGVNESVPVRFVEGKKLKARKLERGDIVIEVSGGSKDQPTGRSLFISDNILKLLELPSEPASFCRRFQPVSYGVGLLLAVHFQLMYKVGKTWEYQNQSTGISNFQTTYFLEAEHVVVPSQEVLDAFVKLISPMMDMIHSNQNMELTKLRDTLLPKLLSGEIQLGQAQELAEVE